MGGTIPLGGGAIDTAKRHHIYIYIEREICIHIDIYVPYTVDCFYIPCTLLYSYMKPLGMWQSPDRRASGAATRSSRASTACSGEISRGL